MKSEVMQEIKVGSKCSLGFRKAASGQKSQLGPFNKQELRNLDGELFESEEGRLRADSS